MNRISIAELLKEVLDEVSLAQVKAKYVGDGDLFLSQSFIESLPNNLKVNGLLSAFRTKINSIPDNLKVEEDLDLTATPLSRKYTKEEIKKRIEDKGGYVKGSMYG